MSSYKFYGEISGKFGFGRQDGCGFFLGYGETDLDSRTSGKYPAAFAYWLADVI